MSDDISRLLGDWPYDSDEIMVRIVSGDDGRERIQLRVDLGLLQLEMEGRPDGLRPEGQESWLEVFEQRQREHDEEHPDGPPMRLTAEDCLKLWREGIQYYHRYLSLWHLERYEPCVRDTERNLRLFAFVREHGPGEGEVLQFDQWRPYVTMIHTRAVATPLVDQERIGEALQAIESGIDAIRDFLEEYDRIEQAAECAELKDLEDWRETLLLSSDEAAESAPDDVVGVLRRKLRSAVADEQFEEAARLRDEIRRLSQQE